MQSASWIDPTLLQVMKARTAVLHRVVRKLRAWPAPNDTHVQAKKVRFFTLQPVIALDGIRIGEQWVGGEEGGVQRDHGGCEHRRTAARALVLFNFARKLPGNFPEVSPEPQNASY